LIGAEIGSCADGQEEEGCCPRRTNRGGEVVVRVGGGETVRGEMELERERKEEKEKRSRCATASGGEWFGETPRREGVQVRRESETSAAEVQSNGETSMGGQFLFNPEGLYLKMVV